MSEVNEKQLAEQGKFKTWKIAVGKGKTGDRNVFVYEVRRADEVYERFDNEREALEEMRLQDRMETQNRSTDMGM